MTTLANIQAAARELALQLFDAKVDAAALDALIAAYLASLPTTLPAEPNKPWLNGGMICIS